MTEPKPKGFKGMLRRPSVPKPLEPQAEGTVSKSADEGTVVQPTPVPLERTSSKPKGIKAIFRRSSTPRLSLDKPAQASAVVTPETLPEEPSTAPVSSPIVEKAADKVSAAEKSTEAKPKGFKGLLARRLSNNSVPKDPATLVTTRLAVPEESALSDTASTSADDAAQGLDLQITPVPLEVDDTVVVSVAEPKKAFVDRFRAAKKEQAAVVASAEPTTSTDPELISLGKNISSIMLAQRIRTILSSVPPFFATIPFDPNTPATPPIPDPTLLSLLSSERAMNGYALSPGTTTLNQASEEDEETDPTPLSVFSILDRLFPNFSPNSSSGLGDASTEGTIMLCAPLIPDEDTQIEIAHASTVVFKVAEEKENTGIIAAMLGRSGQVIIKTTTKEVKVWVPSRVKVSLQASWWGFRIYLPAPVMAALDATEMTVAKKAAVIVGALSWLVTNAPPGLPPQVYPILLLIKGLLPILGYIGGFIAWSWDAIKSFNTVGDGVVLSATWLLPVALIPGTLDFKKFPAPPAPTPPPPTVPPTNPAPPPGTGTDVPTGPPANPSPTPPPPTDPAPEPAPPPPPTTDPSLPAPAPSPPSELPSIPDSDDPTVTPLPSPSPDEDPDPGASDPTAAPETSEPVEDQVKQKGGT